MARPMDLDLKVSNRTSAPVQMKTSGLALNRRTHINQLCTQHCRIMKEFFLCTRKIRPMNSDDFDVSQDQKTDY